MMDKELLLSEMNEAAGSNDNTIYDEIEKNNDPSLIIDISTLRCYINNYGYSDELKSFLNKSMEEIYYIAHIGWGSIPISDVINNYQETYDMCNAKREQVAKEREIQKEILKSFMDRKDKFCHGLGWTRLKYFLNAKIKNNDKTAYLLKTLMEAEEAKLKEISYVFYSEEYYKVKNDLIEKLVQLYNECNWRYGYMNTPNENEPHIICFFLNKNTKICFPCTIRNTMDMLEIQVDKEDMKDTLNKIEEFIYNVFDEEIEIKKEQYIIRDLKKAKKEEEEKEE